MDERSGVGAASTATGAGFQRASFQRLTVFQIASPVPVDTQQDPRRRTPPPPTPHVSPFRRLLPFGLDEFFDIPPKWRSHRRRRPSEFFVQMIPAFLGQRATCFSTRRMAAFARKPAQIRSTAPGWIPGRPGAQQRTNSAAIRRFRSL